MTGDTNFSQSDMKARLAAFATEPGGLLPALHDCHNAYGYIDKRVIPILADVFNLSRAEVHGVISFYHDFRDAAPGAHVIKICQAEACQAMGTRDLTAHAKRQLGIEFHQTQASGRCTLEPVYCLGNCACAPAIMIDDAVYGRVDKDRFDTLLSALDDKAAKP